jgi:hypothetical protein
MPLKIRASEAMQSIQKYAKEYKERMLYRLDKSNTTEGNSTHDKKNEEAVEGGP